MGGYGLYIWPAYGAAAVIMAGLLVASLSTVRARRRELAALEAEGHGRRRRPTGATTEERDDAQAS